MQCIQGRPGAAPLVGRVGARDPGMDIHDPSGEWRPGPHQLIEDDQQAVEDDDLGAQLDQRLVQASFEVALAGHMLRAPARVATVGGRHVQQQIVHAPPLYLQFRRVEPLLSRPVGESVVLDLPLVAG